MQMRWPALLRRAIGLAHPVPKCTYSYGVAACSNVTFARPPMPPKPHLAAATTSS